MSDRPKVLVVDDEPLVRDSLTDFLQDEGFHTWGAESAEQALAVLATERFDLAVVDVRLPRMDGNALIAAAHRLYPWMKFLILTGSLDYALPRELHGSGLTSANVLHKPLSSLRLITRAIDRELNRGASNDGDDDA